MPPADSHSDSGERPTRARKGERPVGVSRCGRRFRARIYCEVLLRRVSLGLHPSEWAAAQAIRRYLYGDRGQ